MFSIDDVLDADDVGWKHDEPTRRWLQAEEVLRHSGG
jgi:hypothetical protein